MDYFTGNQFLTLNDYKNIEIYQNQNAAGIGGIGGIGGIDEISDFFQSGGALPSLGITVCIGILLLYISITIVVIVYYNKNKTNNIPKNEVFKKNSLFVLLMIIFSAGIFSSIHIASTTNQILLFSSILCAIGLSTDGIFYFAI